jgi:hypothetical protein
MTNIVVLEIQKDLITPAVETNIHSISKFYEVFKDKVIAILLESRMTSTELYNVMSNKMIVIEMYKLNNFARNRLINNFENDRPELTLTLMGCGEDSKLIKIWEKYVKRTN